MKAPINWLKDFTTIDVSTKELADKMTLTGSKVEEIIITGENIRDVYVGEVLEVSDHPDSDHLHILKVDLGSDDLGRNIQIVCGAPNVYVGMRCPVAIVGAVLPEFKIKKGKIRGVESFGMCCSIEELGFAPNSFEGASSDGLWDLNKSYPLGLDIKEILGLGNETIDFEITSNRPDCFSIEGLGREAAITLGHEFKGISPCIKEEGKLSTSDNISVKIMDSSLCYRYTCRMVEDVKIGPSPSWMVERLNDAGIRSINNIVDITNYVCLELGQPMHAFDMDYLSDKQIIVRRAEDNEEFVSLDGNKHTLDSSMLVIADTKKVCALAGVMGGENSEVIDSTTSVLFESATFNGVSVRRTAIKNGLRTESSSRFEKGLDSENALRALERACELVEELGCGKVSRGAVDVYPTHKEETKILFRPEKINSFIGIDASCDFMMDILSLLGCKIVTNNDEKYIIPPTFRPDLESEADISEEIARFYGYGNIKSSLMSGSETTLGGFTPMQQANESLKNSLVASGYFEAITYSFESPTELDLIALPTDSILRNQVKILNPLGDDTSSMRTTMLPSMLRIASRNANRGVTSAKVFEVAFVYLPKDGENVLPYEKRTLCGFNYDTASSVDSKDLFYSTRSHLEEVFEILGIRGYQFEAEQNNPSYHPGRTAACIVNGKKVGTIGIIHPDVAINFEAPSKACFFELDAEELLKASKTSRSYKSLPRFPGINRDIAILVNKEVTVGSILRACKSAGGNLLKSVEFFDVYEDPKLGENMKSVAVSLSYRAEDRTLSDNDIVDSYNKIIKKLEADFGAKLR